MLADYEVAGVSHAGITVMRTHLMYKVRNFSATGDFHRIGMIKARASDIGTNRLSVTAEPDLDWMLIKELAATSNGAAVNAAMSYEVDLKAKRKIQEKNETLALSVVANTAAGTTVDIYARVLLALP